MMYYKIKVGIEEYPIDEADIPRIVEAMKLNEMVKLTCGIFRGQSILAVARDLEKEEQEARLALVSSPTPEQIKAKEDSEKIAKQMSECTECKEYKGWVTEIRGNEKVVIPCKCTRLMIA